MIQLKKTFDARLITMEEQKFELEERIHIL